MKRVGVIGIVIEGKTNETAIEIQKILSEFSDIIIGRMGIPVHENNINTISLIIRGENEKISALNGKLGRLVGVHVKSAVTTVQID